MGAFDYRSGKSQEILIDVLVMSPVEDENPSCNSVNSAL